MIKSFLCLVFCLVATIAPIAAQPVVSLTDETLEVSLNDVIVDAPLIPPNIRAVRLSNLTETPSLWRIETKILKPAVFAVYNGDPQQGRLLLEVNFPDSHIETRASQGPKYVSSPIAIPARGHLMIYFITPESNFEPQVPIMLLSEDAYDSERAAASQLHSAYYGASFILFCFFLTFAVLLRAPAAAFYAIFLAALVALNMHSYGVFVNLSDAIRPHLFALFRPLQVAVIIAYLAFASSFLNLSQRMPWLARAIQIYIPVLAISLVLEALFHGPVIYIVSVILPLTFLVLGLSAMMVAIFRPTPGSTIFAIGFFVLALYSNTNYLTTVLDLPFGDFQVDAITVGGQLLDAAIFASAIIRQTFALRGDRDRALRAEVTASKERLRLSEALHESRQNLDRAKELAAHQKSQIAATRHDLQQPMSSLQLAIEQAEKSDPELAGKLTAGVGYIRGLISETAGDDDGAFSEPQEEQIEVALLFQNLQRLYGTTASEKGLELRFVPSSLNVTASVTMLIRVMSNLVSNSIKYTESGRILVGARRRAGKVDIEVWDTGGGLNAADLQRVMARGERGRDVEGIEGDGLGLAISVELAEAQGLSLNGKSKVGSGSVFALCGLKAV
ncbi:MAG: sensor histidine kinase [Pseudomonadota bacterium]